MRDWISNSKCESESVTNFYAAALAIELTPTQLCLFSIHTYFLHFLFLGTYKSCYNLGSLLALGALFGSLSAVFLMDAVGRKASLLAFSVMSLFIGWTLLMAASQAWQLYVGRFLLGLGAGLEITISPVYIHETTRVNMRDICGSFPMVNLWKYLLQNICNANCRWWQLLVLWSVISWEDL